MSLSELHSDIAAFRHYLQSERGMADNTVQAYGRDLDRFANWCGLVRFADYTAPTLSDLGRYLSFLHDEELAPPSIARHLVALKMFYRFLRLEERADAAAVDLLGSPKLWERIPQVLSAERGRGAAKGPRSRRPVLSPRPRDARNPLCDRLPRIGGGGAEARGCVSRLRLLPLFREGEQAARGPAWADRPSLRSGRTWQVRVGQVVSQQGAHVADGLPSLSVIRTTCLSFVSKSGPVAVADFSLGAGEEVLPARGVAAHGEPAHAATQFRDAHALGRRGPAHGPGTARARLDPDDAALHPRRSRPPQGDPPAVPSFGDRGQETGDRREKRRGA